MELQRLFFGLTALFLLSNVLCVSFPGADAPLKASNLVSHLRNKRRASSHKRPAKKPKSKTAKTKQRLCSWDGKAKTCRVDESAAADYVSKFGNDMSRFIGKFAVCDAAKNSKSCASAANCLWDAADERCYFVDITQGNKDSKCLNAAPDFVSLKFYAPVCAAITSMKRCNRRPYCSWESEEQACAPDIYQVLYGFPEQAYDTVASTVLPHWINEWLDLFLKEFDLNDPEFKWRRVLDWDVPMATCPKNADPKVCEFIHESTTPLLPNQYYCGLRYDQSSLASKCNKDSLCKYDEGVGGCLVAASDEKVASVGFKATLQFIETPLDQKVISNFASCYEITKQKKCTGKCSWDSSDNTCISKQEWVHRTVASVDEEGKDLLCTYLSILADSGCLDLYFPDACNANPTCAWRQLDAVCLPTAKGLVNVALQQDPDVRAVLDKFEETCAKEKTKKKCTGNKNASRRHVA